MSCPADSKIVDTDRPKKPRRNQKMMKRDSAQSKAVTLEVEKKDTEGNHPSTTETDRVPSRKTNVPNQRVRRRRKPPGGVNPLSNDRLDRDVLFCPICVEKFDEVELRYFPCPCGYRVCAMCIHLIKEKADGKCPSCRSDYSADRERVSDRIGKDLLAVMREAQINEKREAVVARKKLYAAHEIQERSKRKTKAAKTSKQESRTRAAIPSTSSARGSVVPPPPPPVLKLARFAGGLSVWD